MRRVESGASRREGLEMSAAFYPMPKAEAHRVWAAEILGTVGILAALAVAGRVLGK